MRYILLTVLVLSCCQDESKTYYWFQGTWISDREKTISMNPHLSELNTDEIAAVRRLLGSMIWEVSDDQLTVALDSDSFERAVIYSFSIDPMSETEFRFISENEKASNMTIRKVGSGICVEFDMDMLPVTEPLFVVECYEPYDTHQSVQSPLGGVPIN